MEELLLPFGGVLREAHVAPPDGPRSERDRLEPLHALLFVFVFLTEILLQQNLLCLDLRVSRQITLDPAELGHEAHYVIIVEVNGQVLEVDEVYLFIKNDVPRVQVGVTDA